MRAARVHDARIVGARLRFERQRILELARGSPRRDVRGIHPEVRSVVEQTRPIRQPGVRVEFDEPGRVDRLTREVAQAGIGQIARAERRSPTFNKDAQRERPRGRLFELLDLRPARFGAETFADRDGRVGVRCARLERVGDDAFGERQSLNQRRNLRPSRARS